MLEAIRKAYKTSYINADHGIDQLNGVVSLLTHNTRAVIIIEELLIKKIQPEVNIQLITFIPANAANTSRIETSSIAILDKENGLKNRNELLSEMGFEKYDNLVSWSIAAEKIKLMLKDVIQDQQLLSSKSPPNDARVFPLGYNALLWAKEKLEKVERRIADDFNPFGVFKLDAIFSIFSKSQPNQELLEAAKVGDCERIRIALMRGAEINNTDFMTNRNALYYAILHKHRDAIILLKANGGKALDESDEEMVEKEPEKSENTTRSWFSRLLGF